MGTKDCMPDLMPANDSTASRESPSAFWPAPKMQMSRLVSSNKDASPSLSFASISSRCSLSAFPSAVEKQIICASQEATAQTRRVVLVQPCLHGGFLAALAQIICFSTADGNADRYSIGKKFWPRSVMGWRPSYSIPDGSSAFWELTKMQRLSREAVLSFAGFKSGMQSLVPVIRCSQAYGHQRLHARPEASK